MGRVRKEVKDKHLDKLECLVKENEERVRSERWMEGSGGCWSEAVGIMQAGRDGNHNKETFWRTE